MVMRVPTGSPSRGGDVAVYVFDVNQLSLYNPFYSVLVSISVSMALSTVFHSINSPDNCPLSHSVFFPLVFLLYWFFQVCLPKRFARARACACECVCVCVCVCACVLCEIS